MMNTVLVHGAGPQRPAHRQREEVTWTMGRTTKGTEIALSSHIDAITTCTINQHYSKVSMNKAYYRNQTNGEAHATPLAAKMQSSNQLVPPTVTAHHIAQLNSNCDIYKSVTTLWLPWLQGQWSYVSL